MKSKFILISLLFPLVSCSNSSYFSISKGNSELLSDSELGSSIKSFFSSYYELDTLCSINYNNAGNTYEIEAKIVDKVSSSIRYNNYDLTISLDDESEDLASGEFYYTSDSEGYVVESYINISNEIDSRTVTDTSGNYVKFLGNYNSPFYYLTSKNSKEIISFFDVDSSEDGYKLSLNNKGYDLLKDSFNNFFNKFTYKYVANFDSKTYKSTIKNIVLNLNSSGIPISFSFNRVESDFYGAIVESFNGDISSLDSAPKLNTFTSKLTSEEESYFNNKISSLKSKLSECNFTQYVTVNDYFPNDEYTALVKKEYTYHNFYDGSYKIMLSDYEANDANYGSTYIACYYYASSIASSEEYSLIGISPSQDFYGQLSSSYPTFSSMSEFVPSLSISSDFFSCKEENSNKIYTFDISNFAYDDYYFSLNLIEAILGECDPSVIIGVFVADSSYNFSFDNLVYTFDSNDNLTITLNYNDYYGEKASFSTYYSDFASTSVSEIRSSNSAIDDCLLVLEG